MATFAPEVPEQNPQDFLNYARPTQEPMPNQAGLTLGRARGEAFSTLGEGINRGANLAEGVQEEAISSGLHQAHDKIDDSQINFLSGIYNQVTGQKAPVLGSGGNQPNTMPPGLEKYPGVVDNLMAIKANGSISNIGWDAMRDQVAKQYRASYPGQRDFIDQENFRMTRASPANRVINDLTSSINSYLQQKQGKMDQLTSHALSVGLAPEFIDAYHRGAMGKTPEENDLNFLKQIAARSNMMHNLTIAKSAAELSNLNAEQKARVAQGGLSNWISNEVATDIHGTLLPMGDQKIPFDEAALGMSSGKYAFDTETARQQSAYLDYRETNLKDRLWQQMNARGRNGEPSWVDTAFQGNAEKARQYLGAQFQTYDGYKQMWNNPQTGFVMHAANAVKSSQEDFNNRFYKDPFLANYFMVAGKVQEMFKNNPTMANAWLTMLPPVDQVPAHLQPLLQHNINQIATQTTPVPGSISGTVASQNRNEMGNPYTLDQAMVDTEKMWEGSPDAKSAPIPLFNAYLNVLPKVLTNPQIPTEVKHNVFTGLYNDRSYEAMERFQRDHVNANGQRVKGADTAASLLYSPEVSHEVARKLAKEDPVKLAQYETSLRTQFGVLMHQDIQALMREDPRIASINYDTEKGYSYQLSPEYSEGITGYRNGKPVHPPHGLMIPRQDMGDLDDTLDHMNTALRSIGAWAEYSHHDMRDFLLQQFQALGLDPNQMSNTLAGKFLQAYIAANSAPKKAQDASKQ